MLLTNIAILVISSSFPIAQIDCLIDLYNEKVVGTNLYCLSHQSGAQLQIATPLRYVNMLLSLVQTNSNERQIT